MTEIERIKTAKAAVAQVPGGEIWLEELLIRGEPGGGIKGGHAIYAYRAADAFGGKTAPQIMSPFPLTVAAAESAFKEVVGEINTNAVDTVTQQNATIASLAEEREALVARGNSLVLEFNALLAKAEALQAERDAIRSDRDEKVARVTELEVAISALQSRQQESPAESPAES